MSDSNYQVSRTQLLLLMGLAYLFSVAMRLIWVYQFHNNPDFYWNGELMINTNDGYFFASGAQKVLYGMHMENPRVPGLWNYGVVFFTTLFAKITPFSLETIILYMPTFISSIVVVPIILISRLYGRTLWGFFAALIGAIAWSYYNRTMTGYYDTDMFSAMAPMFILYFLMKSTIDFNLRSALYAALAIAIYPFLYDQGRAIVYAMGLIYAVYLVVYHKKEKNSYLSMILLFCALTPVPLSVPYNYLFKIVLLLGLYLYLKKANVSDRNAMIAAGVLFLLFLGLGKVFPLIWHKIQTYTIKGTEESGLHFFAVNQTVREAGKIPFEVMANRISGSIPGVIVSLIGYVLLVVRHRAFILALPLIGIGIFSLWGGLRFTVYAVPVAALSAVYLFCWIGDYFRDTRLKYATVSLLTAAMLYPNITHIIAYKVPTVFSKQEVALLDKLGKISDPSDYTLSWWDYGYPIWFYSDTVTLIDGGKHDHDNFILSKILTTDSQIQAANLSRTAVETYVSSGYKVVADTLFKEGEKNRLDPNELLERMESDEYPLPKKSREIYLYLPQRMLGIFPTVALFSNLDLKTGERYRQPFFYMTGGFRDLGGTLDLGSGIVLEKSAGLLRVGSRTTPIKRFVNVGYDKKGILRKNVQKIDPNGTLSVIYMQSYRTFLVLDEQMYRSLYIQLFVLEEYDHDLFEPIVMSPYAKIYRLKK